jgi:hypothetical protein
VQIEIAGATWHYAASNGLALPALQSPYPAFVSPSTNNTKPKGLAAPRSTVQLTLAPPPDLAAYKRQFETSATSPQGPAQGPLWVALGDVEMAQVTLFCHPVLADSGPSGDSFAQVIQYPLDQLLLIQRLSQHQTALIHTAAIEVNGQAVLLAGASGAGKSTSSSLLCDKEGFEPFADDRIALRLHGQRVYAFGTPWAGQAGIAENRCLPLKAICFLEQANETFAADLRARDALPRLLEVASVPWYEPQCRDGVLATLDTILNQVPCYTLRFQRDADRLAVALSTLCE